MRRFYRVEQTPEVLSAPRDITQGLISRTAITCFKKTNATVVFGSLAEKTGLRSYYSKSSVNSLVFGAENTGDQGGLQAR